MKNHIFAIGSWLAASVTGLPALADYADNAVQPITPLYAQSQETELDAAANYPILQEVRQIVHGQDIASPFMRAYSESLPPIGYVQFCERNPLECIQVDQSPARVELTEARWQELESINRFVNHEIYPTTDKDLYGRVEFWTYPNGKGDCEDYVLLKRRILMERGWPRSALLITVVLDEEGAGHAILTVRTSGGDFILDNKKTDILAWSDTPYRFLKRQSYRNPQIWISLYPEGDNGAVAAFSSDSRYAP